MRDLTTTELEHCAGGAPVNNGFARPTTASAPQGDSGILATTPGPMHGGLDQPV